MNYQIIIRRCLKGVIILDAIIVLVLLLGFGLLRLQGAQLLSVQSASMAPIMGVGDAAIVSTKSGILPTAGEIISYRNQADPSMIVSHRVVSVDAKNQSIVAAGDSNSAKDSPVQQSAVIGEVVAVLPGFGYFMDALRQPRILALLIYLPAAILVFLEAERAVRHFNRTSYQLLTR